MRNRTIGINVRVSENEKKKLQRNAKKSNLNLSAYLRKSGLQQKIYEVPDEKIYKIYTGITLQIWLTDNDIYYVNQIGYDTIMEYKEKILNL